MKIIIRQDDSAAETEITVVCRHMDAQIEEILAAIRLADNTVTGRRGEETCFIPLKEILYFESVENKVFFCTDGETCEMSAKLYQLEEKLQNSRFARISKSVIANLNKVRSIRPEKNSRLNATLVNGERLVVSRQYITEIKNKLGV
ncbi:MAG: LytTR family transcriptional regulator DNA-binding domain-containing protein [Clostridia bacterium]|nr:LytTR family transcriptional regulator DNA-binding domain-containing protein [Clostridia bacterium]